ncbi:MAG: type II secretion system protein GspF [Moraxellaceae bacterium]|nr:MAG: type II secretion system protein GspF [Moraxellaceae bacterium]
MAAYEYTALDNNGKQVKGILEGDSPRQVRNQLKEKGFVPLSVEETVKKSKDKEKKSFSRDSINASELSLLTRQLATLLQAGVPLEETLRAVSKQSEKPKLTNMMLAIRSKVVEGHSLAQALSEFPKAFPELFRATVAAGEHSGHLDLVLEQLADYTESSYQTQKKIKGAMIYPVVLMIFAVLIVVGMLTFVVPKMAGIFESSGQELPGLTRGMIASSEFLQSWWWLIGLIIVGSVLAFQRALEKESFRYKVHQQTLKIPLIGKINRGFNAARVISTLSILSKSGVPLVEALRISGQVSSNLCIREAVMEGAEKLKEGATLFNSLDQSGYFPPMMMQMVASGESSGELDSMLGRAASNQERELEDLVSTMVSLFEPLMLVVMGGVVMTIVLAIMLPMMNMNSAIG